MQPWGQFLKNSYPIICPSGECYISRLTLKKKKKKMGGGWGWVGSG